MLVLVVCTRVSLTNRRVCVVYSRLALEKGGGAAECQLVSVEGRVGEGDGDGEWAWLVSLAPR